MISGCPCFIIILEGDFGDILSSLGTGNGRNIPDPFFSIFIMRPSEGFINPLKGDDGKSGLLEKETFVNPGKSIPNCGSFNIKLGKLDKIFAFFGFKKRFTPKITILPFDPDSKMQRFALHQIERLNECVDEGDFKLFWTIAKTLFKSNVFIIMQLNKCFPQGHRKATMGFVLSTIRKYHEIVDRKLDRISFKRVYIKKSDGSGRPLGVPTPSGRMYLGLLSNILTVLVKYKYPVNQHGFFPGRGTLTAWKQILEEVVHCRDIYEFDLKKFFDRIDIRYVYKELCDLQIPQEGLDIIGALNRSYPRLNKITKLPEVPAALKAFVLKKGRLPSNIVKFFPEYAELIYHGLPQGSPTSPLLTGLSVKNSLMRRYKTCMYADDGLYYGNLPTDLEDNLYTYETRISNAEFHMGKSGWVKRDGVGLKPLKFLGLEYNGVNDTLSANTRNGSRLLFDKQDLFRVLKGLDSDYPLDQFKYSQFTWDDFVKSRLMGYIQARMYQGSWNLEELNQCFDLSFVKGSGMDTRVDWFDSDSRKYDIFNSSSYACASLNNILMYTPEILQRVPKKRFRKIFSKS